MLLQTKHNKRRNAGENMKNCKITKLSPNLISYRGFYFGVNYIVKSGGRGSVNGMEYYGMNAGMKRHFWTREELKRCVDRRIDSAMKVYCESYGWDTEDNPLLAERLAELDSAKNNSNTEVS